MKLSAIDLGDDVDVKHLVREYELSPPPNWEDPVVLSLQEGEIYIYNFGAVVGKNMDVSELLRLAPNLMRFVDNGNIGEVEELNLEEDLNIKEIDEKILKVTAFALAQSVALSRMEKIMDNIEEEVERVLYKVKKVSGKKALKVAKNLMKTRHELISDIMILEKPSLTWEEDFLDEVYEKVAKYLELTRRYRVMEKRLESALETVQLLISISSEARSNLLELTIILLIFIEIILYLFEMGIL